MRTIIRLMVSAGAAFAAVVVTSATPAAVGTSSRQEHTPSVLAGERLVRTNCASCHAIGPAEDSPVPRAPPFRGLSDRYPVRYLEEALVEGIVTAHPAMPSFAFSAEEAADIVAYLENLSSVEPRPYD